MAHWVDTTFLLFERDWVISKFREKNLLLK